MMFYRLLLLLTTVNALSTSSKAGSRILSKARRLDNDDGYDFSWVTNYSIKFQSCHNTLSFRADGNSADGEDEPTEIQRLVLFKLCPTDKCSSCKGGAEYLVEMREFVEAYYESQMTQQEYNCEKVQDNCDCENRDDDAGCLTQCYADAGLDYCEEEENDDEFEVDKYLECEDVGGNDDDSNSLYVGAYCSSNGNQIYLGAFSDRQCTKKASTSTYKSLTGYDLPYTSSSLVTSECFSCKEPSQYDDDYNADQYDADEVTELCEELYERSAKCEKNLKADAVKQTGGCNYIHKVLPRMESVANRSVNASTIWMWVFLCTTILASIYAFLLYRKLTRKNVDLAFSE